MTIGNAREVLVAELLGDTGRMLDRIDAVMPKLEATIQRMERVSVVLPEVTQKVTREALKDVYTTARAESDKAATHAATDAVKVVSQGTKLLFHAQTRELRSTASEIFDREVTPPLRELTSQLHAAICDSRRNPWDRWITHAATATVAMLLPIALPLLISLASPAPAKASSTAPVPECAQPAATSHDAAQPAAASAARSSKGRAGR